MPHEPSWHIMDNLSGRRKKDVILEFQAFLWESNRSVTSDAVGQCLCSPFSLGFPAVAKHLND
jgi:hypothetical protein